MKKYCTAFLLVLFFSLPQSVFSQYFGGNADGFTQNELDQSICSALANTNIYFGGNEDGFAENSLIQTICPTLLNSNIYFGGNEDGFAENSLIQTICPTLLNTNIYFGGNEDGFAENSLTQTICPTLLNTNIYFGGNEDGFAENNLIQTICPTLLNTNIYFGGNEDGFAENSLSQIICNTLPIYLLSFTGECENGKTLLKWSTSSELNNDFFTIESTFDAINYRFVSEVKGSGNSNSIKHYSSSDEKKTDQQVYYRLKQTDFDGNFEYFDLIAITCEGDENSAIKIYPNPTKGKFTIEWSESEKNKEVIVYNYLGEKIWRKNTSEKFLNIDLGENAKGIYNIHINSSENNILKKLIVE